MKKLIEDLQTKYEAYEVANTVLERRVREFCDFNARITYCEGDGHMVLNEETSSVAFLGCLEGKTKRNKLNESEHESQCI